MSTETSSALEDDNAAGVETPVEAGGTGGGGDGGGAAASTSTTTPASSFQALASLWGAKASAVGSQVWTSTLETYEKGKTMIASAAAGGGSSNSGTGANANEPSPPDTFADTMEDALAEMKRLIQQQRELDDDRENGGSGSGSGSGSGDQPPEQQQQQQNEQKPKKKSKWDFPWTPFAELNTDVDSLLTAFCKWSTAEVEDYEDNNNNNNNNASEGGDENNANKNDASGGIVLDNRMNITKAFTRLQSYVNWMEANSHLLELEQNQEGEGSSSSSSSSSSTSLALSVEVIAPTARRLGILVTHDVEGRMVWWLDVKRMHLQALQDKTVVTSTDIIRFMVWLTHVCMLDSSAQDNGLVICEDVSRMGLWTFLKSFPVEISHKMDRLTVGVLPLKMKQIYVLRAGSWLKLVLSLMKPFMSKKMRSRIIVVDDDDDANNSNSNSNNNDSNTNENMKQVINFVGGTEYIPINCCGLNGTLAKDILFGKLIPDGVGMVEEPPSDPEL